jgi:cytoskeleton protein RodZ
MPTVGEQLRSAREALKLDHYQVAEATKLKSEQIRALEDGDHEYFSAPVYLRGSLRTYAKMLKLDPAQLVTQLDQEIGSGTTRGSAASLQPGRKTGVDTLTLVLSRLNWAVVGGIVGVIALVLAGKFAYSAWQKQRTADPLKKLSTGRYEPAPGGETLPVTTNLPRVR